MRVACTPNPPSCCSVERVLERIKHSHIKVLTGTEGFHACMAGCHPPQALYVMYPLHEGDGDKASPLCYVADHIPGSAVRPRLIGPRNGTLEGLS